MAGIETFTASEASVLVSGTSTGEFVRSTFQSYVVYPNDVWIKPQVG